VNQFNVTEGRLREAIELTRDAWNRSIRTMRNTPGLLLLSTLLGVSLWVFVTEEENPTRVDTLSSPVIVQAVNVEEGLAVANQLPAVEIRLAAPEERWEEIQSGLGSFIAFVDLNGVTEREQEVPVQVEVSGVRGVRVVETIPERLVVNLEDLTSVEVPVRVRPVGTMPLGYELGQTQAAQPTVTVIGPESLVSRVNDAVADLNVTGLTLGVEQTVTLIPRGAGGGEIRGVTLDPPAMAVSVSIRESTLTRALSLRASTSGAPAPGYRVANLVVSPATLQVEGTLEALQSLEAVDLPAVGVTGELTDVTRAVTVELPEGVSTSSSRVVTVVVQIAPIEGTLTLSVAVAGVNLGVGLVMETEPATVEVTISGPLPLLGELGPADLTATVDLAGLGVGEHMLEPSLVLPEGTALESLQPAEVFVTLASG
jgi:YbbR domain-containing protein